MRILICGNDGYEGYPLTAHLLQKGHEIIGIDSLYRRKMVEERGSDSIIPILDMLKRKDKLRELGSYEVQKFDIAEDYDCLKIIFETFKPEVIMNLVAQPSAPYSMISPTHANFTLINNVQSHMNLLWLMKELAPKSHMITVGTMGAYGFPNMPIPEGFFQIEYKGMRDILPFPRQGGSVYHVSKIQASHLCWMAARIWMLRITDVQQSVVYGTRAHGWQTRFDIDECFGTFLNRAVASAIIGYPITVYGSGNQIRAFISLEDVVDSLTLMAEKHPTDDDSFHGYRVINQFDKCYSISELAETIKKAGNRFDLDVKVTHIENPRVEPEVHYYNPSNKKLYDLGWKPTRTLEEELIRMFEDLIPHKERLLKYKHKFAPKIKWRK